MVQSSVKKSLGKKVRVLIVDDSALVRQLLTDILNSDPNIEVIGTAPDPLVARDKIKLLSPDVLTLDIEMPRMDGLTFLTNLMRLRPMPVVMVSSLTEKGADVTLQALEQGAIDYVSKPKADLGATLGDYASELITKVKVAAKANVHARDYGRSNFKVTEKHNASAVIEKISGKPFKTTDKIIAIGASTGGTEAIKDVLTRMPPNSPGIVIAQHIPEAFSASFAKRMDSCSALTVSEARDGDQIIPGHAYIAPGNKHLLVRRNGAQYVCHLSDGPAVNRHKPSVDVLFRSVAQNAGANAIGVILTGMGDDGARGLLEMHDNGSPTLAQDEKTSVVWGMPGEAVAQGGVDHVMGLSYIPAKIFSLLKKLG